MPARLHRRFRMGNWNEELGILLLKSLAAVALVPRPEDIGVDAIATLLRLDKEGEYLYAEDSFYVQLKSKSKKPVIFNDHAVEWLKNLQLPFFIGEVSRENSSLRVFPGHALNKIFLLRDYKQLRLKLGPQGNKKWRHDGESCDVFLGQPLLTLTVRDIGNAAYLKRVYGLLKEYLVAEQQNVYSRSLRFCRDIEWVTNECVILEEGHAVTVRNPRLEDLHRACEALVPSLQVVQVYSEMVKDRSLAESLACFVDHLSRIWRRRIPLDDSGDTWMQWDDPMKPLL